MKKLIIAATAVTLVLASCGSSSKSASTTPPVVTTPPTAAPIVTTAPTTAATTPATTAATTATSGGAAAGSAVEVKIGDSNLGKILQTSDGKTLYMFTKDTKGVSNCSGGCASAWPPLIGTPTGGDGVDASNLSTITRADGTMQVTFFGYPVYFFAADAAPGDTNGQGESGSWYVLDASGNPVKTTASAATGTADTTASTTAGSSTGSATAASVEVKIGDSSLGKILQTSDGKTLYMFTKDTKGVSNCSGTCATNWPPLLGTPTNGDGVDADDISTITRADGTTQVTYYGYPVYFFAADAKAGDVNGQGEGGLWYVLDGSGNPVKTAAPAS